MKQCRAVTELPYNPPLDWPYLLQYLRSRSTAGVERVTEEGYCRTVSIGRSTGRISIQHHANRPSLTVTATGAVARHIDQIAQRVRTMCDLHAPILQIYDLFSNNAALKTMAERHPGVRVPGAWSNFELLVRTIVGQQVTVKAATTIMGRIAERAGSMRYGSEDEQPNRYFPSPAELAEADLSAIGMPSKRAASLQYMARAVAEGTIPDIEKVANAASIREALLALPGIGPWTVEYFALRALRDADAWPGTDLVLKRFTDHFNQRGQGAPCEAGWRPYRGYAAMIVWRDATAQPR